VYITRVCMYVEACVSDLSRPSHISRSVAFAPSYFPSRTVNDLADRCSRCSKVVHYTRALAILSVLATDCFKRGPGNVKNAIPRDRANVYYHPQAQKEAKRRNLLCAIFINVIRLDGRITLRSIEIISLR